MEIAKQFDPLDETSPWTGFSPDGRVVYIVRFRGGLFAALGVHEPSNKMVFAAQGSDQREMNAFISRMEKDGAIVHVKQVTYDPPLSSNPPDGTKGTKPVTPPSRRP